MPWGVLPQACYSKKAISDHIPEAFYVQGYDRLPNFSTFIGEHGLFYNMTFLRGSIPSV